MTSIDQITRAGLTLGAARSADRDGGLRLEAAGVWMVIPCYRVTGQIVRVIEKAPAWVEGVVCVDDACPDGSGDFVEAHVRDPRVVVIRLETNQGVGGATLAGYAEAAARGGRILVKVDGDDQMDLECMAQLVAPIVLGEADYAKGNRFTSMSHIRDMPAVRVFGNAAPASPRRSRRATGTSSTRPTATPPSRPRSPA